MAGFGWEGPLPRMSVFRNETLKTWIGRKEEMFAYPPYIEAVVECVDDMVGSV